MRKNRERSIGKLVYFTETEIATIENKMAESGMTNFSAYCREMLLTGEIKHYDFSQLRQLSASLGRIAGMSIRLQRGAMKIELQLQTM